jgi:DNA-binding HxlR family transcriptional regulator
MEILYVLGLLSRSRFTQLQRLLGVSSRTLSDKLKHLREAGFIDREIFDEQPVRIEYFLTKSGRKVAALAAPLLAHLGQEALRAGRLVPLSPTPSKAP